MCVGYVYDFGSVQNISPQIVYVLTWIVPFETHQNLLHIDVEHCRNYLGCSVKRFFLV